MLQQTGPKIGTNGKSGKTDKCAKMVTLVENAKTGRLVDTEGKNGKSNKCAKMVKLVKWQNGKTGRAPKMVKPEIGIQRQSGRGRYAHPLRPRMTCLSITRPYWPNRFTDLPF